MKLAILTLVVAIASISCKEKTKNSELSETNLEVTKQESIQLPSPINNQQPQDVVQKVETNECKNTALSSDPPLAVWPMKNAVKLIVCNLGESYDDLGTNSFRGWLNIFPSPVKIGGGLIPEVDSELADENISYFIQKESDTKIKIQQQAISEASELDENFNTVLTTAYIECTGKECILSKKSCSFKKPSFETDPKKIQYLYDLAMDKTNDLSKFGHYDLVIDHLIKSALSGNKKALALVLHKEAHLRLDGAAASIFNNGSKLIHSLIKLNCIEAPSNK